MTIHTAIKRATDAQSYRVHAERARKLVGDMSPGRTVEMFRLYARLLEKKARDTIRDVMRTRLRG